VLGKNKQLSQKMRRQMPPGRVTSMRNFNSASALIERLANQGCRIWVAGDKLRVSDPEQVMTDTLRQTIREHKAELLRLLRSDPANDRPTACPTCGDPERWPTDRGPVCPTCWLAQPSAPQWRIERDLNPESVREAWQRFQGETHSGEQFSVSPGKAMSQFNTWLEAHGCRPTTLPVLRQAIGKHSQSTAPSYLAKCSKCGGTDWGPTGRVEADGCEGWHCLGCAKGRELRAEAARAGPPPWYGTVGRRF
jgi:hypothetical protein